jgi:hypothetical protein
VFEYARIRLRDDHGIAMPDNPARWVDLKAMGFEPPAQLSRGRHPSLPHERLPAFLADLRARDAVAARALVRIPTQSGHRFRLEAGQRSDLMPAGVPRRSRPAFRTEAGHLSC